MSTKAERIDALKERLQRDGYTAAVALALAELAPGIKVNLQVNA